MDPIRGLGPDEFNALVYVDGSAGPTEHDIAGPGPLDGRLVVVKDNIAVRGAPWACGSATRTVSAGFDAEVVRRVRAAGGVVAGTTNLDEFAMGASTETSASGATRNPWDPRRTAGGSSGGSAAAVAAYDVLALGTDTGGSIREPAAFCGVVGVTPSPGSVPTDGVVDFAPTFDRVGSLAATVAEAALLHEVIAQVDGLVDAAVSGAGSDLHGMVIGVAEQMSGHRNAPEVIECFDVVRRVLIGLGARLVPITLPRFGDLLDVYVTLTSVEALPILEAHEPLGRLGAEAASRLRLGRDVAGTPVHREAMETRERIRADVARTWQECELLISPTVPLVAPLLGRPGLGDPLARPRTDWWTVEANLAGIPAASIPAGLGHGLPVGVQLMAPAGEDRRLYSIGAALERRLGVSVSPDVR